MVRDGLMWACWRTSQGLDGRRYVLDTARTFPPVAPASEYLALLIAAADAAAPYSPSLELVDVPVAGGMQPVRKRTAVSRHFFFMYLIGHSSFVLLLPPLRSWLCCWARSHKT